MRKNVYKSNLQLVLLTAGTATHALASRKTTRNRPPGHSLFMPNTHTQTHVLSNVTRITNNGLLYSFIHQSTSKRRAMSQGLRVSGR